MDTWTKKVGGQEVVIGRGQGTHPTRAVLPPGEPPLCCVDKRKNPTVNKPVFPSGSFECPPAEGGCGAIWTREKG